MSRDGMIGACSATRSLGHSFDRSKRRDAETQRHEDPAANAGAGGYNISKAGPSARRAHGGGRANQTTHRLRLHQRRKARQHRGLRDVD